MDTKHQLLLQHINMEINFKKIIQQGQNKQTMNNEKSHTYIVHQYFYMETQFRRKSQNIFSYMYLRIAFIGSTNFLCSSDATGRRLQPPSFSGYNLREAPTPQFSGYNQKEAKTPYVLRIQPEGGYNHLSLPLSNCPEIEVEWWNQFHAIIVRYTALNLYQ